MLFVNGKELVGAEQLMPEQVQLLKMIFYAYLYLVRNRDILSGGFLNQLLSMSKSANLKLPPEGQDENDGKNRNYLSHLYVLPYGAKSLADRQESVENRM